MAILKNRWLNWTISSCGFTALDNFFTTPLLVLLGGYTVLTSLEGMFLAWLVGNIPFLASKVTAALISGGAGDV